ncbi:Hypothetical protein SRAE_2000158100 [Strongyloides ratti]|uniref:Uncharacterized protein n=1 Tax=Strongyloides ratti TaxID=34506 RepID=A0A090LHE0_STRRB|nr:Hypothetical protein SRAE_2000158100 [Strongyloides ratti]CEF66915.1 Hypothetical protein SRAE_2000158100 [Strongyloides ratti]
MIEGLCVILLFLVFYLLHQTDDSLGIVRIYREFINLPYVDVCYHNCHNPVDLKKISNVKDCQSVDNEKLTLNTCVDFNEHHLNKQNPIGKKVSISSVETTQTTQTNTPSKSDASTKPQSVNTPNDDSNKGKSVYLSTVLRKHLK